MDCSLNTMQKLDFYYFNFFLFFGSEKLIVFDHSFDAFIIFFLVYHVWMQACGQNPFPLRTNFKQLTPSFLLLMFAVFYYKRNIFITILGSNSKEKERGTCPRVHLCTCISKLLCYVCFVRAKNRNNNGQVINIWCPWSRNFNKSIERNDDPNK